MQELVATGDGSLTLKDPATGELYHNKAGAYTEALENYFLPAAALERLRINGSLALLDVCFGLGYNSFVLLEYFLRQKDLAGKIDIVGIELDQSLLEILPRILEDSRFRELRAFFHSAVHTKESQWNGAVGALSINLDIRVACLRQAVPSITSDYDLVFHDPFSPKRRPEFWTIDLFRQYYRLLLAKRGAVLTYSSAVAVRTALRQLGFSLMRTVAVGEKTGGTLASLSDKFIDKNYAVSLTDEEELRLVSRSAIPYRDPELKLDRAEILKKRQHELLSQATHYE